MPPRHLPLKQWFFQPNDSIEMAIAVYFCLDHQLYLRRFGPQLKVGDINFYPSTGTIMIDGGWRFPESGFLAFQRLIARRVADGDISLLRTRAFKHMTRDREIPADPIAGLLTHLPAEELSDPSEDEGHAMAARDPDDDPPF